MASVFTSSPGKRGVQYRDAGKTRTLRLGRISVTGAEIVREHVEHLLAHRDHKQALPPATVKWLEEIGKDLHDKLVLLGIAEQRTAREVPTLGYFVENYIKRRTDLKPNTVENLLQTKATMVVYFGNSCSIHSITRADAKDWHRWLTTKYSPATVSMHVKKARQFFADALDRGLVTKNPFKAVKAGSQANPARMFYVSREVIERVIDKCPSTEWKLLFALARYAGLRVPSETALLRWRDVDQHAGRMVVSSPKTEHHAGREKRVMPILPEVSTLMRRVHADADEQYVLAHLRHVSLRTQAEKIIRAAGFNVWPKLFQNLRSSAETDLTERFPLHVVVQWIGNTEAVAMKHYLQVTDEHFEAATRAANPETVPYGTAEKLLRKLQRADVKNIGKYSGALLEVLPPRAELPSRDPLVKKLREVERALQKRRNRAHTALTRYRKTAIVRLTQAVRQAKRRSAARAGREGAQA